MSLTIKQQTTHWLHRYIFINFLLALLISSRYLAPHELSESVIANVFIVSFTINQIGLFTLLITALLRFITIFVHNIKLIKPLAIFVSSLALCALITDTFIYQQYRFHFNSMLLELLIEGGTEIFSFTWAMWFQMVAMVIAFFGLQIFICEFIWRKQGSHDFKIRTLIMAWLAFFLISNSIHAWADAMFKREITQQARYLPLAYPLTAKSFMAKFGLLNVEAQKQQALLKQKKIKSDLHYPLNTLQCASEQQPLNVVMVAIDSWRNDMMDSKITPAIHALAQSGFNFSQHYSGSNNTRHGMFSLFYGLLGHYWPTMLDLQRAPVLMDELQKQQYQMGIFASAKLTSPEFDQTIFRNIGNLRTHSSGSEPYERDLDITEDFISWHQDRDNKKPFFSFLLYDAAHGFSLPPGYPMHFQPSLEGADYLALDDDYDPVPFINLYKNAIHFADSQIGKVLAQLDLSNTMVIITGDHGKEFNESKKNFWGHNSNYSPYQTRVPLIVYLPNKQGVDTNKVTSHYDIAPTILTEVLNCGNDSKDYSSGHSLFSDKQHGWLLLGRNGYYAIQTDEQISELDRYGNFTIFDKGYQKKRNGKLNMKVTLEAMDEIKRFYKDKAK